MKSTGIVRRVDDLGRVVIPKEIRRTLSLKEGDSVEIYVNRSDKESPMVCMTKYKSDTGEDILNDFIARLESIKDRLILGCDEEKETYNKISSTIKWFYENKDKFDF